MLLPKENLLTEFRQRLESAQEIDIATAWATSGSALVALEDAVRKWKKPKSQLRTIVGISGNATDPEALERLNKIGQLRLAGGSGSMFHPKVYIFREPKKSVAWIGSVNFTRAGFESNEETVFEVGDVESIVDWFDTRWNQCEELKPTDIDDYRKRREENPPSRDMNRIVNSPPTQSGTWKPLDSFEEADKAKPFPTKIRYRGQNIGCEWTEEHGHEAWGKMFVCLADWLTREGTLTEDDCPVEIGRKPLFPCVDRTKDSLWEALRRRRPNAENKLEEIHSGLWVAIPEKKHCWRAKRAKELLRKFSIDPGKVELRMSE